MFAIRLSTTHDIKLRSQVLRAFDDNDSPTSVIAELCIALQDADAAQFIVSGFGEARWSVDVGTDLAVVMEQMPDLYDWLNSLREQPFLLDFYEQGVERRLIMRKKKSEIVILGKSLGRASWPRGQVAETLLMADLTQQLDALIATFWTLIKDTYPEALAYPLFQQYFNALPVSKATVT